MDLLVNACDPDREGEAIFRRIIHHAGVNKPTRRLWVASLEEEAIRQALAAMKPEGDYRGLADSAMIRAKADWLIDMNASRAYSLVYNTRFTVGRVQTPTLAMIVERDRQIESHKPTPFWKVVAPMGSWTLTGTHLENHGTAEALLEIVNQPDFAFGIYAVKRHRQHDAPPRLYDLTNLQKDMSKLHGLTAAHTLTALQSLYEQRLTTYPRTDSRFITHDDLDALRKLTNGDRLASGFLDPAVRPAQPRLELTVNDAKVTGHTAILPTLQASGETLGQLGDDKRLVLTRVVRRMWEAVADDHVHDVTLVVANIDPDYDESHPNLLRISEADSRFTSCSDQTISLGWKGIEPTKTQEHDGGEDEEDAPAGMRRLDQSYPSMSFAFGNPAALRSRTRFDRSLEAISASSRLSIRSGWTGVARSMASASTSRVNGSRLAVSMILPHLAMVSALRLRAVFRPVASFIVPSPFRRSR